MSNPKSVRTLRGNRQIVNANDSASSRSSLGESLGVRPRSYIVPTDRPLESWGKGVK